MSPERSVTYVSERTPATCGWKLIATVDTRPKHGDSGGQYGVSISDSSGTLGKFRYLLFDSIPSEDDDPWGSTFFSEINVVESGHRVVGSSDHRKNIDHQDELVAW